MKDMNDTQLVLGDVVLAYDPNYSACVDAGDTPVIGMVVAAQKFKDGQFGDGARVVVKEHYFDLYFRAAEMVKIGHIGE